MLHLQSGALKQAIPVITYTLAPAPGIPPSPDIETDSPSVYSIREGGVTDDTTSTFTIMRSPTNYNVETNSLVTITNIAGGNPDGFGLEVGGLHLTGRNFASIPQPITFAAGENEQTISFQFTGNDTPNDDHKYTIRIAPANVPPGDDEETITFTIEDDDRGIDLLAIDDSVILETAVENEAGSEQRFVRIYPDATPLDDILTEVGVPPDTFTITQIVLSITGSNIDADTVEVMPSAINSSTFTRTENVLSNGNEFTFDSRDSDGVAIDVAETFLKSLKFGINRDEPTDGADTLDVNLEFTITDNERGEETEAFTITINEINDPVELVGLTEGAQFTVLANDLFGSGSLLVILPEEGENITVNDGGDDSGVSVEINPSTFSLPTAADPSVMGTLTLSDDVTPEGAFTLSISRSDVELAATNVMTTLSFNGGRDSTDRTITIRIVSDEIPPTLPEDKVIKLVNIDKKQPFTLLNATQVTLEFYSAYDRVGTEDAFTYTRDVDYVIAITRMGNKQPLNQDVTMSADDLNVDPVDTTEEVASTPPASVMIKVTLDRNDVNLIPGDSYMVDISVTDRAGNPADTMYVGKTFTMLQVLEIGDELAGVDCGGPDSDNDGIASAYELHIGTNCQADGIYDYIGSVDPVVFAEITVPFSPPDVYVVAAGASTYTQIDTGVMCKPTSEEKTGCDNLKAFIVSSGLGGEC